MRERELSLYVNLLSTTGYVACCNSEARGEGLEGVGEEGESWYLWIEGLCGVATRGSLV